VKLINISEKPNIRFTFKDDRIEAGGPVISPATEFDHQPKVNGTFGLIFKLTPELGAKLKKYHVGMVPMILQVHLPIRQADGGPMRGGIVRALVYWDPLYTADGLTQNLLANEDERKKWKQGLRILHAAGVPTGCIYALQRRLTGERVDPEPLWSDFIQPEVVELWERLYGHRRTAQPQPMIQYRIGQDGRMAIAQPNPMVQGRMGQDGILAVAQPNLMVQGRMGQDGRMVTTQPNPMIQGRMGQDGRMVYAQPNPMIQGRMGQDGRMVYAQPNPVIPGRMGQDGRMVYAQPNPVIQGRIRQDGRTVTAQSNSKIKNPVSQGVIHQVATPIAQSQPMTHYHQAHRPIAQPRSETQNGIHMMPTPPRSSPTMPIAHPRSNVQGQNKRKADSGEAREELKRMRYGIEKSILQTD
jgi:hypothetical protein